MAQLASSTIYGDLAVNGSARINSVTTISVNTTYPIVIDSAGVNQGAIGIKFEGSGVGQIGYLEANHLDSNSEDGTYSFHFGSSESKNNVIIDGSGDFFANGNQKVATRTWVSSNFSNNSGDITGVTAGNALTGGGSSGSVTINHADTSSQGDINTSGGTVIDNIYIDGYGHVTSMGTRNLSAGDIGAASSSHSHSYGDLPMSSTDASNWDVAYDWVNELNSETRAKNLGAGTTGTASNYPHLAGFRDGGGTSLTYQEALADAAKYGARLPTIEELEAELVRGTGYGYDSNITWTCSAAGPGKVYANLGTGQGTRVILNIATDTAAGGYVVHQDSYATDGVSKWNTAYAWGDHANAGYLTSHPNISSGGDVNTSGATIIDNIYTDGNGHVTSHGTRNLSASDIGAASAGHNHNGDHIYPNAISVGDNGSADSYIRFYDDNSNAWRVLRWDDSRNNWAVEDNGGTHRLLYHEGHKPTLSELGAASDSHGHSQYYEAGDDIRGNVLEYDNHIQGNSTQTRDKIRVWTSNKYTIGMKSGMGFGHLADYAMTFQMSDNTNRGWWWGHENHTDSQGAMSLTTDGRLYLDSTARATDFITYSDRRLKSNIERVDDILSIFKPINLYSFQKEGKDYPEIGLIAQEVQKGHPLLTQTGVEHEKYDDILELSAHSIASLAVGGVKELIGRTDTMMSETDKLKKKVADQQEQINDLKEKLEELK